jgi:hypothetical protein
MVDEPMVSNGLDKAAFGNSLPDFASQPQKGFWKN